MSKRNTTLFILIALLTATCLLFAACDKKTFDSEKSKEPATVEQTEQSTDSEPDKAITDSDSEKPSDIEEPVAQEAEQKTAEEKAEKEKSSKEKEKAKKKSSKSSGNNSSESQPKEKKKVWVEPVTETHTVTLDTGTRYCCGSNSNGGCGASWHGSKESTYSSWKSHWQDYVRKKEAEDPNYQCDHIHDDSKWVPDTTTETVVVQEGYWKEVD